MRLFMVYLYRILIKSWTIVIVNEPVNECLMRFLITFELYWGNKRILTCRLSIKNDDSYEFWSNLLENLQRKSALDSNEFTSIFPIFIEVVYHVMETPGLLWILKWITIFNRK